MTLHELNALTSDAAAREFLRCCGSSRWARAMAAARPFATIQAMTDAADNIWNGLEPRDWLEAFGAHPRIGDAEGSGRSGRSEAWAQQEQSGAREVSDAVRERLRNANRAYEARFGYIFIVCATGRSAGEMLSNLEQRLANDPDDEIRVAGEEQRKIMRVRMEKLMHEPRATPA